MFGKDMALTWMKENFNEKKIKVCKLYLTENCETACILSVKYC